MVNLKNFLALLIAAQFLAPCPGYALAGNQFESSVELKKLDNRLASGDTRPDIGDQLQALIAKEPTNSKAHILFGTYLQNIGLPKDAIEEYKLGVKFGPNSPAAFADLAKSEINNGQMEVGMQILGEAFKRFPKDVEILVLVADYFYEKGKVTEASELYRKVLESTKTPPFGAATGLAACVRGKNPNLAAQLCDLDLKQKGNNDLYRTNTVKGFSLRDAGRYKEAIEPLYAAFVRQKFADQIAEATAQCLFWDGQYQKAVGPCAINLSEQVQMAENNVPAKTMLITILRHCDLDQAKKELDYVGNDLRARGARPGFFYALGRVYDEIHKYDWAIDSYRIAIDQDPDFGIPAYCMGQDYELRFHNYTEALKCYKYAQAKMQTSPAPELAVSRLEDRLDIHQDDWAWRLRDDLHGAKSTATE